METRIKERLVGGIALVAIVVIIVPELLTGPRARVPAPATAPTVTIDLAQPEHGAITRSAPPAEFLPVPAAAPPRAPAGVPDAAPAAVPAPDAVPGAAPAPASAATPVPPAAPAATQVAAEAPAPRPLAHGAQAWVVQLGSFQGRENADRLAAQLRAKGYAAFVSEFRGSGALLYRVRVGPEQDRARADAIAARLQREGLRGTVAPDP